MNAPQPRVEIPSIIGTATEIGLFFARIRVGDATYALFQPPKASTAHAPAAWNISRDSVDDAFSFSDGYANTVAMAKAGSKIAQYALDHGVHIPALDEADLQYRIFKPTTEENECYARAGINLSAESPLQPYTPKFPAQTELASYRAGAEEAFGSNWHWTSTQYRAHSGYAWAQHFGSGGQDLCRKGGELPVRFVRREIIR